MKPANTVAGETGLSTCSSCGTPFHCGRDDASGCWCAQLPALPAGHYDTGAGCLCETCLRRRLEAAAVSGPPD